MNNQILSNLPCTALITIDDFNPDTLTKLHLDTGEIIYFADSDIFKNCCYFVDKWGAFDFTQDGEKVYYLQAKETQEALKHVND